MKGDNINPIILGHGLNDIKLNATILNPTILEWDNLNPIIL